MADDFTDAINDAWANLRRYHLDRAQIRELQDELDKMLPDGRSKHAQEMSLIASQLANCHKEIKRLRAELLRYSAGDDHEPHKIMTPEEYATMPLKGWHEVCRDIDGFGGVGIRYLGVSEGALKP